MDTMDATPIREDSIQGELAILDNKIGALISIVHELNSRTRPVRIESPSVATDPSALQESKVRSSIGTAIANQTSLVEVATSQLEIILMELSI